MIIKGRLHRPKYVKLGDLVTLNSTLTDISVIARVIQVLNRSFEPVEGKVVFPKEEYGEIVEWPLGNIYKVTPSKYDLLRGRK